MTQTPSVGKIVHYAHYGTPGGEYASECRAAIITAVDSDQPGFLAAVDLCVLNPDGMFFDRKVPFNAGTLHPESEIPMYPGGTWHFPERGFCGE